MLSRLSAGRRRRPVVDLGPADLYGNPYPWYRWLREQAPVAYAPALRHHAGLPDAYWLVTRWDEVVEVLKDDALYGSPGEPPGLPLTFSGALPLLNGDRHARIRSTMQPACTPRRSSAFADAVVRATTDDLLDKLEALGEAELMDSFFEPLAARTLSGLLGLGDVPVSRLRTWFDHLGCYYTGELFPQHAELDQEIDDALLSSLRRLTGEPDSSLLSTILQLRTDPETPSEHEILGNAKFFTAAGVHELCDLVAHALIGLLSRPEQLAEVQADPALAKAAIEEAARWSSPVGMVPRRTTAPTELAGVRIPPGALVAAIIASANRDESHWTEPSSFDLHRDEGMHLGYASGAHFCLGAWVARAAGTLALQRLVERLPKLRLKPDDQLVVTGWRFRDVRRLSAAWS